MTKHFTEEQVREWAHEGIDRIEGESRRWHKRIKEIVEIEGKFYQIEWDKGLTECQENKYWEQDAPEVAKVEKQVTKTITVWEPVEAEKQIFPYWDYGKLWADLIY